jgi:hypothetical protein
MKVIILGKKNMAGTNPSIRIKGMSQKRYNFIWDKEIRFFAYEPKDQKEIDDIFRTQGRLYSTMFFSVYLEEKEEPEAPKPKAKSRKKAKSQPVEEPVVSA